MNSPVRLAILVGTQGRGSNMAAIAQACADLRIDATVAGVIGSSVAAPALARAEEFGLTVRVVDSKAEAYGDRLTDELGNLGADIVCLAGYMRLLPLEVLDAFPNRVLNIHPALLPKFGGKGMYGRHVHEAVLAAREAESGCTVHLVTERYDEGLIVIQLKTPIQPDDTPDSLAGRVLELEHRAYPMAIQRLISEAAVAG